MDERLALNKKQAEDFENLKSILQALSKDNVGIRVCEDGWLFAVNKERVEKLTDIDDYTAHADSEECADEFPSTNIGELTLDYGESWFRVKYKGEEDDGQ